MATKKMAKGGKPAPTPKGDSFEKVKAAYANENNRINAAKAAGTYKQPEVRGMMGSGPPASRPTGGMSGPSRPMARPARPMGGMGMKKGGKAKGKK
jgi:hypothetical protein